MIKKKIEQERNRRSKGRRKTKYAVKMSTDDSFLYTDKPRNRSLAESARRKSTIESFKSYRINAYKFDKPPLPRRKTNTMRVNFAGIQELGTLR